MRYRQFLPLLCLMVRVREQGLSNRIFTTLTGRFHFILTIRHDPKRSNPLPAEGRSDRPDPVHIPDLRDRYVTSGRRISSALPGLSYLQHNRNYRPTARIRAPGRYRVTFSP